MKPSLIIAAIAIGGLVLIGTVCAFWSVSQYNSAASLKNQYAAKAKANEAVFDNMWKKIAQTAEVTEAQKRALLEIFTGYAQARTGGSAASSGSFINAVREAVPQVDVTVFRNLQNIIAGSRDEWTANQVALVDIAREYNLLLVRFPSNLLLGALGFERIDPRVITSTRTEETMRTGRDDHVAINLGKS